MNEQKRWSSDVTLLLMPALAFILLVFIFPFLYALYLSFTVKGGGFTLANYIEFFSDNWELRTIWVTLWISLPVTIISTIFAIPLAYYMRKGIRYEKLITLMLMLPTTLGMVLVAEGMLTYLGPNGWFNKFLMMIGVIDEPLRLTHNYTGVVLSLFIQNFPMGFLMLLGYVSGISSNLESASRMLGASRTQTFWKVLLPLMSPGIAIAFALNFTAAFSVFPSAIMLGSPSGPTRVMAYAAYQWSYEKYNENFGSTICIIMVVIQLIIVGLTLEWRSRMYKGASAVGKG